MSFPCSKILDLADLPVLAPELACVDAHELTHGQASDLRRWEYAMALHTLAAWRTDPALPPIIGDIGGAGSNFGLALRAMADRVWVIDPAASPELVGRCEVLRAPVEEAAALMVQDSFDALTAISVIEHVAAPQKFFRACHRLLKPGGLLFFTTDCWNCDGPDTAHFSWMRKRIYNPGSLVKLGGQLREIGFKSFGEADWSYPGDTLYCSYSLAAMAMVKR